MEIIYGVNPIKVLLRRQQSNLEKVIVAAGRGGAAITEIIESARRKRIPLEFQNKQHLDQLTGKADHQGVIGFCRSFLYADLDDLLKNKIDPNAYDLLLILDGVMDPQNLGAIIRTSYCLGVNGIVIPVDRAASVTAAVVKASAGSVSHLPIARVTNLSQAIDYLKERGFWVFGADAHEGGDLKKMDFNCPVALVMGGEAKGIRSLIRKKCDFLLSVPLQRHFDSLNVSVAAGIILYEILNRRAGCV